MDLSPWWPYIEEVASHRLANNRTERHVSDYGEYIEVIGAAGELAARRFLGLSEELHEHFDGGADLLYKDIWVDVKTTVWTPRLQRRFLQWPYTKPVKANIVFFVAVDCKRQAAIVVGYALPHEIGRAPLNTSRDYPCFEIPVPKLHPAVRLLFAENLDDLYGGPKTQTRYQHDSYRPGQSA